MSTSDRSAERCPECGAHRLATVEFPSIDTVGYQPYNELIGMGQASARTRPAIGCLHCGAEWADLEAFRAAQREPGNRKPRAGELGTESHDS